MNADLDFSAFGALPIDVGLTKADVSCRVTTIYDRHVREQLGYIREEAELTRGGLRLGIAIAILIIDRQERFLLGQTEAVRAFELADTDVCGVAAVTRQCDKPHEWVVVTTKAAETFELPIKAEGHL